MLASLKLVTFVTMLPKVVTSSLVLLTNIPNLSKYCFEITVGGVGARVVFPQIKEFFKKKKIITCLADICGNHGNVDSIQVAHLRQTGHLW